MTEQDEPRAKWFFTFGFSHRLIAVNTEAPHIHLIGPECEQRGFSLAKHYAVFTGTREEARHKMMRKFGSDWAFQYSEEEARPMIVKHNLTQLGAAS